MLGVMVVLVRHQVLLVHQLIMLVAVVVAVIVLEVDLAALVALEVVALEQQQEVQVPQLLI